MVGGTGGGNGKDGSGGSRVTNCGGGVEGGDHIRHGFHKVGGDGAFGEGYAGWGCSMNVLAWSALISMVGWRLAK